jgi:hypothetical protein
MFFLRNCLSFLLLCVLLPVEQGDTNLCFIVDKLLFCKLLGVDWLERERFHFIPHRVFAFVAKGPVNNCFSIFVYHFYFDVGLNLWDSVKVIFGQKL